MSLSRPTPESPGAEPTAVQLLALITTQTEIAKLGLDLGAVMALVAERAQTITRASGAVVELVEGEEMVYRAVAGAASGMLGARLSRSASLSGLCVRTGTPLRSLDSETDPRVDREACRRLGLRSMVVVPLIHQEEAVGALKVFAPVPNAFDDGDVRMLGLMSDLVAASMFHATRYGAEELFRQATSDGLTGLANRALFMDRLRHGISESKRTGKCLGVLVVELDGLKAINDGRGHGAGDAAIRETGRRIAAEARRSDTVARLGGDDFGVVLFHIEDRASAAAAVERFRRRCAEPFVVEGAPLLLGASVGAAICPEDGLEPGALLERADREMGADRRSKDGSRESPRR